MGKYDSDIIKHVKSGNLEYIQFNVLNKYNVKHCITLRRGGVSIGEHESLNFRVLGTDKIENVLQNVDIIRKELGFKDICKGKQAHTDRVIVIDENNKKDYLFSNFNNEEVDGYITTKEDIATLITTADCNPIIIYDTKKNVIANVHAGWKGVINRIYINAINLMKEKYNSSEEDIIVCIGPSIRKECFTSKEESFKEKFTSTFKYSDEYLEYDEDGVTFHIDLIAILKHELKQSGILEKNIYVSDICTKCHIDDFFSYRYATQNKQDDYATMATIVQIGKNNDK